MGKAPSNSPQNIQPNLYNPNMSGMMGALQGFGIGGKIAQQFGGFGRGGNGYQLPTLGSDPYGAIGTGSPTYGFG